MHAAVNLACVVANLTRQTELFICCILVIIIFVHWFSLVFLLFFFGIHDFFIGFQWFLAAF